MVPGRVGYRRTLHIEIEGNWFDVPPGDLEDPGSPYANVSAQVVEDGPVVALEVLTPRGLWNHATLDQHDPSALLDLDVLLDRCIVGGGCDLEVDVAVELFEGNAATVEIGAWLYADGDATLQGRLWWE